MFGYIRPLKPEMKIKEYDSYKSVYCGLCKTLKKEYGPLSSMFLDYDLCFLAILMMAKNEGYEPAAKLRRCISHPAKKCKMCERCFELSYSAGALILLSHYKVLDNLRDKGILKKLLSLIIFPVSYFGFRKARKRYPEAEEIIKRNIEGQNEIEKSEAVSVDRACHYSAAMIGELMALYEKESKDALYKFGYMVGRYVYLCDAAADISDDKKKGNFNPFINKEASEIDGSISMTLGEIASLYQSLKLYRYTEILTNIIYLGMPSIKDRVVFEPQRKTSRQTRL